MIRKEGKSIQSFLDADIPEIIRNNKLFDYNNGNEIDFKLILFTNNNDKGKKNSHFLN